MGRGGPALTELCWGGPQCRTPATGLRPGAFPHGGYRASGGTATWTETACTGPSWRGCEPQAALGSCARQLLREQQGSGAAALWQGLSQTELTATNCTQPELVAWDQGRLCPGRADCMARASCAPDQSQLCPARADCALPEPTMPLARADCAPGQSRLCPARASHAGQSQLCLIRADCARPVMTVRNWSQLCAQAEPAVCITTADASGFW